MSDLKFKPYARLLTMLGDQLIKNERVALVEVIKNSYDADASWVSVNFANFGPSFESTSDSKIIIEDNGSGMTEDLIRNHWVNPATPTKLLRKQQQPKTASGRVIQGEKGIGRFALLKLGKHIKLTTRAQGEKSESVLTLDVTQFDDDFIVDGKDTDKKALFLDDLRLKLDTVSPAKAIVDGEVSLGARHEHRQPHGTRIEISHLRGAWSRDRVKKVFADVTRLQSIFDTPPDEPPQPVAARKQPSPLVRPGAVATNPQELLAFEVFFSRDGEYEAFAEVAKSRLETLLHDASVLRVEDGRFDAKARKFTFKLDGIETSLDLMDSDVAGLTVFRKRFGKLDDDQVKARKLTCGSFGFAFFVFDFSSEAVGKHILSGDDKELIKEHRIYLYRDGIRVYPYGDPEDDWLGIDIYRGTVRASEFLSNDQVVGYVTISQSENPALRDKTSREGLIDTGQPTEDFLAVLQVFLAWLRKRPYEQYRKRVQSAHDTRVFKEKLVEKALTDAWEIAQASAPPDVKEKLVAAARLYQVERQYLVHRAETTEHLAGVGLSVETASHDLMVAMGRTLMTIDALILEARRPGHLNKERVERDLTMVRGGLTFIETQLRDIQQLFKSSRQRRRDIRVSEVLAKVSRLFEAALRRAKVNLKVEESRTPLVAKTTDAVLLQVLLNLFDNAVYWLENKDGDRQILIRVDGDEGTLQFADNGPGIHPDDVPYIFDAFYSGKGEDGRGLGLYIARQLLERHDYTIELVTAKGEKILPGANFRVSFFKGDE